jgi:hypothetical protein
MSDKKLSDLTAATGIDAADILYVVDGGTSKKVSNIAIADGASVSGSNTGDESVMTGDSGAGGVAGLAPAPDAGDAAAGKFLKASGVWDVPSGSGTGDVTGPASAVADNIAVFDGITGKIIKDGSAKVADFAAATSFIAGAGALTGPAAPLTIGTAAGSASTDFATAAQGTKADNALPRQMVENEPLLLDAVLSADGKYCATEAEQVTAGTALAFGEVAYYAVADSKWEKTDADAEATSGPVKIGIVIEAAAEDATATVMYKGKIREDDWNWATVGAPVYLDTATAGGMTLTAPSGTDDVVRVVGHVIDANQIWFDPDTSYITLA